MGEIVERSKTNAIAVDAWDYGARNATLSILITVRRCKVLRQRLKTFLGTRPRLSIKFTMPSESASADATLHFFSTLRRFKVSRRGSKLSLGASNKR